MVRSTEFLVPFLNLYSMNQTVFHHMSDTKKRVENTKYSRVFLMKCEVFEDVMKQCLDCFLQ